MRNPCRSVVGSDRPLSQPILIGQSEFSNGSGRRGRETAPVRRLAPFRGVETPQQVFGEDLYHIYYRFLETDDEYFDYAPARVPPQGRWRIYGVALPDQILRKVYNQNAERVLGMKLVG